MKVTEYILKEKLNVGLPNSEAFSSYRNRSRRFVYTCENFNMPTTTLHLVQVDGADRVSHTLVYQSS